MIFVQHSNSYKIGHTNTKYNSPN